MRVTSRSKPVGTRSVGVGADTAEDSVADAWKRRGDATGNRWAVGWLLGGRRVT